MRSRALRPAGRWRSPRLGNEYTPIGRIVDERTMVNGVVGLLATGGSTNHTIHLIAMAAAAGICLTWSDMAELSALVPLADPHLSQWQGRCKSLPCCGRHGLPHPRAPWCRPCASGCAGPSGGPGSMAISSSRVSTRKASPGRAAAKESGDQAVLRGCASPFEQDAAALPCSTAISAAP